MSEREYFVHPTALVESDQIGSGTRIWAFVHVMPGAKVGRECNVGDHSYIENGAVVGDYCTIKNGVSVWDGVILAPYVFVGPNVVFTNDLYPRSKAPWEKRETCVGQNATIGANATVICGIRIGAYALVGAGSVVTSDIPDHALFTGNPARPKGYVCACGRPVKFSGRTADCKKCARRLVCEGDRVSLLS